MPEPQRKSAPTKTATDLHRQWLELVDIEGPFLAIPPLKRVWPNGIQPLRSIHAHRFDFLVAERKEFKRAWEQFDRLPATEGIDAYRTSRDVWVEAVLRDVAGWSTSLRMGIPANVETQSPNRSVTFTPHATLIDLLGDVGAYVAIVDPTESLRQTPSDGWAATAIDRMEALLRQHNVRIGIVTDGRWWALVSVGDGSMAASGVFDALTWVEEPFARDAFLTLIDRQYVIGGDPNERLSVLFSESIAAAEEITEALGSQVRRAVELLVRSFSESATDTMSRGLPSPLPSRARDSYEAAVTIMMRVVFLLFAEERGLLPAGDLFEQGYGISRELDWLKNAENEEALDATSLTWHRLLATSEALFGGVSFENARMPAYGGSIFDPARYPFLTASTEQGKLAVTVSDRVMLHVLRSVQIAVVDGDARQISFRDIDVEQIGYIYEGLLGYASVAVSEPHIGIIGKSGSEPQLALSVLEELKAKHSEPKKLAEAIIEKIKAEQPSSKPSSVTALTKALITAPKPETISALKQLVSDGDLRERIKPWLGLVRLDLRTYPFVVPTGGLTVKETPSRKNAGAHYTPKSLAEEVVLHALQPLCYAPGPHQTADETSWRRKSSDEILDLKICDIACGSGAFLVAATNFLADRVVESWLAEDPANAFRKDLRTRAIRQVVANCIYGADINEMAVEMCKLSLWLVSLDSDLPFSFVDDKIFVGNSLLGLTDLEQLRKLHIDPSLVPAARPFDIFDVDIDSIIRKAVDLRERLATEIDENDPARSRAAKQRQLGEFRRLTSDLRRIADGVIAAGLATGGVPGKSLNEAYQNLGLALQAAYPPPNQEVNASPLLKIFDDGLSPSVDTDYERWTPLHWILEAADVFHDRQGFDAVIGNPPFLVSKDISGSVGSTVREWIVERIANGVRGPADLVAYFLLRSCSLLNSSGCIGLVTSKVIAEGDTRQVSLDQLVRSGLKLTTVKSSERWPSKNVSVRYAMLCGTVDKSIVPCRVQLDGHYVSEITAELKQWESTFGIPVALKQNSGRAGKGVFILGNGFLVSQDQASSWILEDPANAFVLRPFLIGKDITSRPDLSASRWVIDFYGLSEEAASHYEKPFERVATLVKPERMSNPRKPRRENWWLFAENATGLRRATETLSEVLVLSIVSKHGIPARVSSRQLFSSALGIFATDSYADQAVLSSGIHVQWAIERGSKMKTDIRYTPSDVFETYPFPPRTAELEVLGTRLHAAQTGFMSRTGRSFTQTYNCVNDPKTKGPDLATIQGLREIHRQMDLAVLQAYAWLDIELAYGYHEQKSMIRWSPSKQALNKIVTRLVEENHQRAALEASQVQPKPTKTKKLSLPSETLFQ